jgi:cytidylate kinase
VLGRGGVVVLGTVPGVLHVMLGGPREARLRQGMRLENLDQGTAERRLDAADRARLGYVRREYGVDPEDPDLFHLRIDSTALDLETCVVLIVAAAAARTRPAAPTAGR